jgi:xanthine dehydrogenase accessory factor
MSELSQICQLARAAQERAEPCWLATVMRVRGSAYRHAGARLLFSSGQILAGSVSGGCLEAGIVRKGPWLTRERAVCVRYQGSREEDDEQSPRGTGCDGTVDILLERVSLGAPSDPLTFIDNCLVSESRGALLTVFESSNSKLPVGARLALGEQGELSSTFADESSHAALSWAANGALRETHPKSRIVHGEGFEALLEVIQPAPQLFLFGAGPDALPVVEFSRAVGFGITVCEPNPRPTVRERFSGLAQLHLGSVETVLPEIEARRTAFGVVMSHHYPTDARALALLLESRALYIGMLGPERRTRRMLAELYPNRELSERDLRRVRAPIGLDLGSETAAQIALSIVAEMQAVLARASTEPLSQRTDRPIHVASSELALTSTARLARTGTQ